MLLGVDDIMADEVNGHGHDRLQNEFCCTDITYKMFESN